jgi:hypothetical protein
MSRWTSPTLAPVKKILSLVNHHITRYKQIYYFLSSVFPSVVNKSKNENIQDYNFVSGFVWVQNLVSDTKGET